MSTRSALTIVGGVVGAYFGYPQLGLALGALVGSAVDPQTIQGPRIGEISVQTSAEGAPRTIVYGTVACYGNVIQTGPAIITTSTTSTDDGKGGATVEGQVAYRSFVIRVCEGPIVGYLRIWEDNKLVYDVRPGTSEAMLAQSAAWAANVNFFYGTEDQVPSVFSTININPDTPAYRGTAYIVVGLKDVTDRRGSIPQYRFEVAGAASLTESLNPLIVYPWVDGLNPVNPKNEHTFQYRGFTSQSGSPQQGGSTFGAIRTDLSAALMDMADGWNTDASVMVPPSFPDNPLLVAWADSTGYFPINSPVAYQQEYLMLHYNEVQATSYVSTTLPNSALDQYPGGTWGGYGNGAPLNPWVAYKAVHNDGEGFGQWLSPDRNYSAETYTNESAGDDLRAYYTYSGRLEAKRTPVPPTGSVKIVGTAKQLAVVLYSGGVLFQNGLGPVLLPDDPNYNNADFWTAARDAAVDAGVMDAGLSYPVVVSEYASGYNFVAGEPITLASIVADIHKRCGIDVSRYDVSELVDLVAGLGLAGDYTGADAINSVRPVYFFDKSEHDKKLWYPKRGAEVIETLTVDDLVEISDTTRREQAIEIPKKLHLFYQHAVSGYARVKATSASSSPDLLTTGEVTIEVPVVLTEDQAARAADKMYKVTRAEIDGTTEISIPLDVGAKYIPSNTIGLSLRGKTRRMRIEEMAYAEGVIKLKLKSDRQSAYTSHLTGVPIPPPMLPPSTIVGDTELAVMDIPARVDSEDDLNYLVAVTGALPAWYGARYQRSLDAGANYTTVRDIGTASVMGELVEEIPTASEYFTDTTNIVRVRLLRDGQTIDGITLQQFLSEGGAFALEKPDGSWEVMQYLDATEESDGTFALSTLHRGRLNSGVSAHVIDAKFVMLASAIHIPAQSSWIGMDLTHRAISLGDTADNTDNEETHTFVGRSQLEWPVASFELSRVGDVVTASWVPRHRFGSDNSPIASVNFRGFRVTITDTLTPASVTFDQVANSFTYDVSALTSAPVIVSVSSLNRITGAGPATTGAI